MTVGTDGAATHDAEAGTGDREIPRPGRSSTSPLAASPVWPGSSPPASRSACCSRSSGSGSGRSTTSTTASPPRSTGTSADHEGLLDIIRFVTGLGGRLKVWVVVLAVAVLLIRRRVRLAIFVVVSGLGALALDPTIKLLVGRLRPVVDVPVAQRARQQLPQWTRARLVRRLRRPAAGLPARGGQGGGGPSRSTAVATLVASSGSAGSRSACTSSPTCSPAGCSAPPGSASPSTPSGSGAGRTPPRSRRSPRGWSPRPPGPQPAPDRARRPAAPLGRDRRGARRLGARTRCALRIWHVGELPRRRHRARDAGHGGAEVVRRAPHTRPSTGGATCASKAGDTHTILAVSLVFCTLVLARWRQWRPILFLALVMVGELTLFLGLGRRGRPAPPRRAAPRPEPADRGVPQRPHRRDAVPLDGDLADRAGPHRPLVALAAGGGRGRHAARSSPPVGSTAACTIRATCSARCC